MNVTEQKNILLVAHGAILYAILTAITEGRIAYGGKMVQLTPGSIHLIQYAEGKIALQKYSKEESVLKQIDFK